jgi:hypothetical protein
VIAKSQTSILIELTRHKLDAALRSIELVISKNHPFTEGPDALQGIKRHLVELRNRILRTGQSEALVKQACKVAIEQLAEIVPLVGFIDRSTDVSGPVEFHKPFSRVVRKLVGPNVKLILSSMWNFSPYTIAYPEDVPKYVENFVYVSFSFSEADNAFLTPLAAHELGHNLWNRDKVKLSLKGPVGEEIHRLINAKNLNRQVYAAGQAIGLDDLFGQMSWQPVSDWAIKQLEESFCDFVALYLFGPSYIYAFAHYLSPGLNASEPRYPQAHERFSSLLQLASEEGWKLEEAFSVGLFDVSNRPIDAGSNSSMEIMLEMADQVRKKLVPKVAGIARSIVEGGGLLFGESGIDELSKQLSQGIPCSGAGSVMSLINAGWVVFIEKFFKNSGQEFWGLPLEEFPRILNEILLKSLEIHEIEARLSEEDSCSMQQKLGI